MKSGHVAIFFAICFSLCLSVKSKAHFLIQKQENIVNTTLGAISGIVNLNFRSFLGIPYALPPVGNLRWKPPVLWR